MLKILNTILFAACQNSDDLPGFYYSHDGYWLGDRLYQASKTKIECAYTCMENCVAISAYAITYTKGCYHYSNRADLVSSNERKSYAKAYIKCLGMDV